MVWIVETLNETVDAELADLPADMRARLARIANSSKRRDCQALESRT